jgi:anti-sigma regulatory factor (Ser/Thr protein kinase)
MSVTFKVAGVPDGVGTARQAVEDVVPRWLTSEALDTVRLLVSELVTNSIVHGGGGHPVEVSVYENSNGLRVEVSDCGPGVVPAPGAMGSERGGFGLFLVERLADHWGVTRDGSTRVWFELTQGR